MLSKLFPFKLQLQIFQLGEYSPSKFLGWIVSHLFIRNIENKKPLIWTQKAKGIYYLAILLAIIDIILTTLFFKLTGFILSVLLATQPYIFLLISYFLLLPYEAHKKTEIKRLTENKIKSFKNLKVIGITGSYGKTSVKEFLYQILKTEYNVLKTPESYNTPYGIARVVDLELDNSYDYFICEMGAYRIGEIKEICDMVHPRYGILTGINEQHLETFGSLENTTKGKFELIDSLPKDGFGIVNTDNSRILEEYKNHDKYNNLFTYGHSDKKLSEKQFRIKNLRSSHIGSNFDILFENNEYQAQTKLLGYPNIQNILAAAAMAYKLGMKPQTITKAIEDLKPVPHRLEIKLREGMTIIDDAYNSNKDGFVYAVELLALFNRPKIIVTPGIVDLGKETLSIHKRLGEFLNTLDYIILVGKSDRTKGLKEGVSDKRKIIEIDSINEVWKKVEELNVKHPVVLLENDLPDNY